MLLGKFIIAAGLLLGAVVQPAFAQQGERPVAPTEYGPVRGTVENGIQVFKGIRYGADTSTTRFQPAHEPAKWTEPADATHYGPASPQYTRSHPAFADWEPADTSESEDLLFLNVWTPGLDDRQRPVMVWFHGGGFVTGSGSSNVYDGVNLATRGDVVVVTVNHRLNAFGYLYLGAFDERFADSGNVGNLDMVMALEWVRDNISAFGGDPERVTIFGQSGGGAKVNTLMAMESADGLFDRAIVQSGSMLRVRTTDEAVKTADAVLKHFNLTRETAADLQKIPAEKLAEALPALGVSGFGPVVDGRSLKRHPFDGSVPEISRDIPTLIGFTLEEQALYIPPESPVYKLDWAGLQTAFQKEMPADKADEAIKMYKRLYPEMSATDIYIIHGSSRFGRGSVIQSELKAADGGAPTWLYRVDWQTPVLGGYLRAPHAVELAFTFDNVAKSGSMVGSGDRQQHMADQMSEAWIAFARHGDPNARGLPFWPAFDEQKRSAMIFNDESKVQQDFFREQGTFLSSLDD